MSEKEEKKLEKPRSLSFCEIFCFINIFIYETKRQSLHQNCH